MQRVKEFAFYSRGNKDLTGRRGPRVKFSVLKRSLCISIRTATVKFITNVVNFMSCFGFLFLIGKTNELPRVT